MTTPIAVIKVGGNELDDPQFLSGLVEALRTWRGPLVLAHGGGKEISAALEHYAQPVQFIEGLRVTPPAAMDIMEMVVCGSINKRLVAHCVRAGLAAIGLSGVDLGLLRCQPARPGGVDLGRVGAITTVATPVLNSMLVQNWLPIIAPVALGEDDGLAYNVNADHVAQGIAAAFCATGRPAELVFVSNVPGVILDGAVVPTLDAAQVEQAIASGQISGGMVPKVRAALAALDAGVTTVRITNLSGFAEGGTRFS
jgi:acetylglutamate kinase